MTNSIFNIYKEINKRLINGDEVFININSFNRDERYLFKEKSDTALLHNPRIAVYVGSGASHSWLWFVDILESMNFHDIIFLSEHDISSGLKDRDALLVSGGETFALAHGLGEKGRDAIVSMLKRGGLYLGSCAGACMMMGSSTEPLGLFDLVNIKIANIVDELPEQKKKSNKFSTPYGCAFVYHPVREEVVLESYGNAPLFINGNFIAPLYGGPPMEESDEVIALARYNGFTEKTDYLTTPEKAHETLTGKIAVCMKHYENGHIILSGPHLEHPSFPDANAIIADAIYYSLAANYDCSIDFKETVSIDKKMLKELKRQTSNLRIVALGLEHASISWLIGRKYYEPEKIRTYVESLWKRILILEKSGEDYGVTADLFFLESAVNNSVKALEIIKNLKHAMDQNKPSDNIATDLFQYLRPLSKDFFTYYFSKKPLI